MAELKNESILKKAMAKENFPIRVLIAFGIIDIAMILISYLICDISVVAVCTIVILETVMAALLNKIPMWVHGLVIVGQIVCGIIFDRIIFMVCMLVVYVAATVCLYVFDKKTGMR